MQGNSRIYNANRHSCYMLEYHLVVVTKYRHPVLAGEVCVRLKEITKRLIEENFEGEYIRAECDGDHIHVLFQLPPQIAPSVFVNSYKTVTSRLLRKEFGTSMQSYYWKDVLWSRSYFIGTVSNRTDEAVKQYIEDQTSPTHRGRTKDNGAYTRTRR